ncbi:MAG: HAMP domain-containing sensor histidine kinase [Bacteroidales bacterium]|jgi:signal transduction histidine kinase|nr:HAMP domain-containing histidine kinase [Bacteroidales bacterium]MDD2630977.1 HAMP domain-containing sensor histidine kinase [Bacteroidales bacterium]MDD3132685.1 HAMP domain-containing sensor histidine kinase [Bacteroidales bacterium]MDD4175915.1 HAMP domain-containing sensor histidine kinase [Bacteroidales bacterium]MDD4740107.1 HAMP domain-containing sensor histidine kinase [Bacteroidales bacterium]
MTSLTDRQLIDELQRRIDQRSQAYEELEQLNRTLRQVNRKLIEAERLKTNFLSNARNEIINPLTAILSLSESLSANENLPAEEIRRRAALIYQEAVHLDFQWHNIFASAEIEAGDVAIEFYDFDIMQAVKDITAKFKKIAADRNVRFVYDGFSPDKLIIRSDPQKLQLILENLIMNAVQYTYHGTEVNIALTHKEEMVSIAVTDHGSGIDSADHERIFDRFSRINPAVATPGQGHGLGLPLTKYYLELLGGEIKLHSQRDHGSTFIIRIPDRTHTTDSSGSATHGEDFLFDQSELF